MSLDDRLGEAYHLDQAKGQRAAAVAMLRTALADESMKAAARGRLGELTAIVNARSAGGRCSAHVELICRNLLAEALG